MVNSFSHASGACSMVHVSPCFATLSFKAGVTNSCYVYLKALIQPFPWVSLVYRICTYTTSCLGTQAARSYSPTRLTASGDWVPYSGCWTLTPGFCMLACNKDRDLRTWTGKHNLFSLWISKKKWNNFSHILNSMVFHFNFLFLFYFLCSFNRFFFLFFFFLIFCRFKSSSTGLLLATDVAARGLDIPAVEHVIHYQVPKDPDVSVWPFSSLSSLLAIKGV